MRINVYHHCEHVSQFFLMELCLKTVFNREYMKVLFIFLNCKTVGDVRARYVRCCLYLNSWHEFFALRFWYYIIGLGVNV